LSRQRTKVISDYALYTDWCFTLQYLRAVSRFPVQPCNIRTPTSATCIVAAAATAAAGATITDRGE